MLGARNDRGRWPREADVAVPTLVLVDVGNMDGHGAPPAAGAGPQAQIDAPTAELARVTVQRDAACEQRDDRGLMLTAAVDHLGNLMSSKVSAGKMVLTRARKMMDPAIKSTEERKDD